MGAVAPVHHWKPEDDLLLKNAVEAGASLESLARGAVKFSQRFTVEELQDRWHSLLYDPVVSAEASAHMIEFEYFSIFLQSNSSKFDCAKEAKGHSGKRKADSIHRRYYAMRKRILSETIDSTDVNLIARPGVTGGEPPSSSSQPQGRISADCVYGDPVCDNFGIQDANLETLNNVFRDLENGGVSAPANDVNNAPAFCMTDNPSLAQNIVDRNICPPLEENFSCTGAQYKAEEFGQLKELPVSHLFEAEDLRTNHQSILGHVMDNDGIPISSCGTSFHNIGYPSPLTQAPVWSSTELSNSLTLPYDGGDPNTSRYGTLHSNANLKHQMAFGDPKTLSPKAAKIIAELSDRLMDFSDQDDLFDTVDKSYLDDLGSLLLDSPNETEMPVVCASKASVAPDECQNFPIGPPDECQNFPVGPPDECENFPIIELPGELGDKGLYHCSDRQVGRSSEAKQLSSALCVNSSFPEFRNGVICCTLNTEDPDIPSNDDVFLPVRLPSSSLPPLADWKSHEAHYLMTSPVRDIPTHQKASNGGPLMMKTERSNFEQSNGGSLMMKTERSNFEQSHISSKTVDLSLPPKTGSNQAFSSKMTGLSLPLETGSKRAFCGYGAKLESAHCDAQHGINGASSQGPSRGKSTIGNAKSSLGFHIKETSINSEHAKKHNHHSVVSYPDNQVIGHDNVNRFSTIASSNNLEADTPIMLHEELASNAELGSTNLIVPKPDVIPALADEEDCLSETDDDVPYFSDIEAMILDMDLSPDDQGLYASKKVPKYQHEESKRTIVRLEQAAGAYMQRAMEANGAFAVLYGRRSKHFIKRPEVLLGRSTEDVEVDVDLGREARANKISRRQAIMKLDMEGSFCLKNFGKCSMFVNGKEVPPKHSQLLTSGCLIEVRGIAFIFETHRTRIKQHVDKVTKGSQVSEQKPIIR